MLPKELSLALRKHKNKIFIYTWEFFARRIHNELLRSAIEESPFFYVEINFEVIQEELRESDTYSKFWIAFFDMLSTQKRHSDLCGFLRNDKGIALLFLDSVLNDKNSNSGWDRFCNEIKIKTSFDMQRWKGIIYAEYPPKEFFISNQQTANA
ncbi:MAG: hypothetical protein LBC64_04075 [Fibromonadaceae bacterium]|jgi:hypothetical protein|nr:hypothetical protein [Fibromonadaceae bacterium]